MEAPNLEQLTEIVLNRQTQVIDGREIVSGKVVSCSVVTEPGELERLRRLRVYNFRHNLLPKMREVVSR